MRSSILEEEVAVAPLEAKEEIAATPPPSPPSPPVQVPLRRSIRLAGKTNLYVSSSEVHDRAVNAIEQGQLDELLGIIMKDETPNTFDEAMNSCDKEKWAKAIQDELEALLANGTWEEIKRSREMNVIDSKWVFVVKHNADGRPERWKARLTARGFKQIGYVSLSDTFAPVARYTTVRVIVAVAASKQWKLEQSDVSNAFLNGEFKKEVFMYSVVGKGRDMRKKNY